MAPLDTDTIAAIATPLGLGGLAVIRISGDAALTIADRVFRPAGTKAPQPSNALTHTVHYGWVVDQSGVLDEVLLTVLHAPRTFTREDTVEVSCHGGPLVTKTVLAAVLAAGARLAEPGEFTKRAFLNGRLDLTQAEAVADVIHAQTELALQAAQEQLAGKLAERINGVRDRLMIALAHIEAHLDFPDEDITPDTQEALQVRISGAIAYLETLLASAREGQVLREGVKTAIIGRPNAGKSSLLNQLLGRERAIVSPVAGTTRDTIEEVANIRGIPVVFVDTAGLRESGDQVEQEGIRRSREAASAADLVLHVIDGSSTVAVDDAALVAEFAFKSRVLVWNKVDLAKPTFPSDGIGVSCITGEGMEALKDAIAQAVWQGDAQGSHGHACINARHRDALRRSHASLQRTQAALKAGAALELVAFELRSATAAIGEIVGKTATDDLLDRIFSQFCLGK